MFKHNPLLTLLLMAATAVGGGCASSGSNSQIQVQINNSSQPPVAPPAQNPVAPPARNPVAPPAQTPESDVADEAVVPNVARFAFEDTSARGSVVAIRAPARGARTGWNVRAGGDNDQVTAPAAYEQTLIGTIRNNARELDNIGQFAASEGFYRVEVDVAEGDGRVRTLDGRMLFVAVSEDAPLVDRSVWNVVLPGGRFRRLVDDSQLDVIRANNSYSVTGTDNERGVSWVLWVTNLPQLLDNAQ